MVKDRVLTKDDGARLGDDHPSTTIVLFVLSHFLSLALLGFSVWPARVFCSRSTWANLNAVIFTVAVAVPPPRYGATGGGVAVSDGPQPDTRSVWLKHPGYKTNIYAVITMHIVPPPPFFILTLLACFWLPPIRIMPWRLQGGGKKRARQAGRQRENGDWHAGGQSAIAGNGVIINSVSGGSANAHSSRASSSGPMGWLHRAGRVKWTADVCSVI